MKATYTFKGVLCALAIMLLPLSAVLAQRVSGRVMDADTKEVLPGASVAVKGSNRGTVADANGAFNIEASANEVLVVVLTGYNTQEAAVGTASTLDIELRSGLQLETAVVTALGFKKEKASLGYATQEVKGADLLKAREPNPINGLAGKVAGLTIGASPELLRGPQINLRGSNPIFVVDGVPVNSDTWNISPDDIESFNVLKGPAAAALYGFRSQDGVIMITTRKGSKDKRGYNIEFNSSQMIESGFNAIPKVQNEYGPGDHGRYGFVDGRGGGSNDGDYDIWGPRFEGQLLPQYDSPIDPATGKRVGTPWKARGVDNLERFLQPGVQSNNNISVSTSSEKLDMRYSTSFNHTRGMVPNTQLNIGNFNMYSGLKFSDRVKLEANLNYNRQFTDNFPDVNYGPNSLIYNVVIWGGADWSADELKNYWQEGKEGVQQIYAEYQRYNNPWFQAKEWLRGHQKTDIYGQTSLSFNLAKGLDLKARTAITTYDLFRSEKLPFSATSYGREEGRGDYREDKRTLFENNTDLYLNYDKKFGGMLNVTALVGGNVRSFNFESSYTSTDYLNVPGLYSFSNTANPLRASNFRSKMQVQSGYYSVDLGLKTYLFLSHTGRVDRLSTLPAANNTFYYPSVSASFILSELVGLGPVSFLKFRGAFANVKSGLTQRGIGSTPSGSFPVGYGDNYSSSYDGPSYENASVYSTPLVYNGQPGARFSDRLINEGLQPLSRSNYETGLEARFLRNRMGIDFTYFRYVDGPQIFKNPISEASGFTEQLVNDVKTLRQGFEISFDAAPVKNASGFSYDVLLNWSTYKETFLELPQGRTELRGFFAAGDRFVKGDRTDAYFDSELITDQQGNIVHDGSGRPIINPTRRFLGYSNPDWVWSAINRLSWKNISFSFQFDGRVGGVITNYIRRQTFRGGRNIETTQGAMGVARQADWEKQKAGLDKNPQIDGNYLGEGVRLASGTIKYDQNGNITNYSELTFVANDRKTYLQDYISRYYSPASSSLMSKTFSKLREITLTYQLPKGLFGKGRFIRSATVSLVGRNLLYFADQKDIDLDNYIGTNYSGLQSPTAKRYGFNFNLTF